MDAEPVSAIELRPLGMYDTGLQVLKPDVDSAVESMIATGCMVIIYEKKTLMSLYKNVSRRNERANRERLARGEPEEEVFKLWTHRTQQGPGQGEGRWLVRIRRPGEEFNPFFRQSPDAKYGRWLPLVEQLMAGQEVRVASVYEANRVGQSFRFACDRRGYARQGHMLQRRAEGDGWIVSLAKPLQTPPSPRT